MTDEELIATLNGLVWSGTIPKLAAARIEELIHSRDEWRGRAMDRSDECEKWFRKYGNEQARADALEKERDEAINQAVLSKASYDGLGSIFLSLQKDCIAERIRADDLEKELKEMRNA